MNPSSLGVIISFLTSLVVTHVYSHGTETRYCITNSGNLRIFVEHWHGDLTSTGQPGTMNIRSTINGVVTVDNLYPDGIINNYAPESLGVFDCTSGQTILTTTCSMVYNDWVYYDFPVSCGIVATYELLVGNTYYLDEGCDNLYPAVFQGSSFTDEGAPIPYVNGEQCELVSVVTEYGPGIVEFDLTATDDCDPNPTVTSSPPSGSYFDIGDTIVIVTATDDEGNTAFCEFVLTVIPAPSAMPSPSPTLSPSVSPSPTEAPTVSSAPTLNPTHEIDGCGVADDCYFDEYPDPHFQSFHRKYFDFHGEGDTIVVHIPDFLDVHMRTESRGGWAAAIAVALRFDYDILEVQDSPFRVLVNGTTSNIPSSLDGIYPLSVSGSSVTVSLPVAQSITISGGLRTYISGHGSYFYESNGLAGKWTLPGYIGRDGMTDFGDPYAMAKDWEVNATLGDPLLFSTPADNIIDINPPTPPNFPPDEEQEANEFCEQFDFEDHFTQENCVFDYLITDPETVLNNTAYTDPIVPVERCLASDDFSGTTCAELGGECKYECDSDMFDCYQDMCTENPDLDFTVGLSLPENKRRRRAGAVEGCSCALPKTNAVCVDSPFKLYVQDDPARRRCGWAENHGYCDDPEVASHCPATCGTCNPYQCTDSTATAIVNAVIVTCEEFAESATPPNLDYYCSLDSVKHTCRYTCDYCGYGALM